MTLQIPVGGMALQIPVGGMADLQMTLQIPVGGMADFVEVFAPPTAPIVGSDSLRLHPSERS
jgi:hypothetical protein